MKLLRLLSDDKEAILNGRIHVLLGIVKLLRLLSDDHPEWAYTGWIGVIWVEVRSVVVAVGG